jgi:hypothetical protein
MINAKFFNECFPIAMTMNKVMINVVLGTPNCSEDYSTKLV